MLRAVLISVMLTIFAYADNHENKVDCLILEDENSIICKYIIKRTNNESSITAQWIDPTGEISRSRDMIIPAGHGSIYDYRYIEGRILGNWTFKVIDENKKEYTTSFELKEKE
jgi:hypothetical protein